MITNSSIPDPGIEKRDPGLQSLFLTLTDPRRGVLTLTLTDPWGGKSSENWH